MRLKRIEIRNVSELHCCWPVGFKSMSEFVELCWGKLNPLSTVQIKKWAKEIYDTDSDHSVQRLIAYMDYIKGFFHEGYNGILIREDIVMEETRRFNVGSVRSSFDESLIRVHENNNVDDGNHRVPVLRALGIKRIPVAIIEKNERSIEDYASDMRNALSIFFKKPEWFDYKKSDDYKILCSKKGSDVMGEHGHEKLNNMYTDKLKMRIGNTWASMMRCQDGDRWDELDRKDSNIKHYLKLINKYIPDKEARILEIGAGDGGETKILEEDGYKNIASITLGPTNVERAKELYGIDSIKYMDMHFTSFRNGEFDAVVGFETYEHSPAPLLLGLEFSRVLKSGGKILLEVPYGESHFPCDENPHHLNVLECWQARNMLKKCGFDNIVTEEFTDIKKNVFYAEKIEEGSHNNHFNDIVNGKFAKKE